MVRKINLRSLDEEAGNAYRMLMRDLFENGVLEDRGGDWMIK
jgi:hypothetical protein